MGTLSIFNEMEQKITFNQGISKNDDELLRKLFFVLPYYKLYDFSERKIKKILCYLLDNYENLTDEVIVTVIATGFDKDRVPLSSVTVDRLLDKTAFEKGEECNDNNVDDMLKNWRFP